MNASTFHRRHKHSRITSWLLAAGLGLLCLAGSGTRSLASTGAGSFAGTNKTADARETTEPLDLLRITMLNVGQGLSVLLETGGHSMIYDGGGRDSSDYVVAYLEQAGIKDLDLMVTSHYDEDHIAGLIGCLYTHKVDKLVCPDYVTDTDIFNSFCKAAWLNGAPVDRPAVGTTYELGDARISVLGPENYSASAENDSSIVLRIDYGEFSCILTGDAEGAEEQYLLDSEANLDADLLVLGHHGSKNSSCQAFLEAVSPKMVWISCGKENSFGHPAAETMDSLKTMGVEMYRTDLQGEVTCSTDGQICKMNVEACEDYSAGGEEVIPIVTEPETKVEKTTAAEKKAPETTEAEEKEEPQEEYVLNKNTKKFHYSWCSSVDDMKEKNKKYSSADRNSIIAQGYVPCKRCKP